MTLCAKFVKSNTKNVTKIVPSISILQLNSDYNVKSDPLLQVLNAHTCLICASLAVDRSLSASKLIFTTCILCFTPL